MTATDIGTLALAGIAIMTSVGSVLLLAFRVGKLTGTIEARMANADSDRSRIWQAIGELVAKFDRHIEGHGRH